MQSTPLISDSGALVGILSTHFAMPHRPTDRRMLAMKDAAQLVANAVIRLRSRAVDNDRMLSSRTLMRESQKALVLAEKLLSPHSRCRIV